MNSNDLREKLIIPAVVGALYAALTMLLAPISYGNLQFRISEALCVLPVFFPYTSVGLFLGCALANMISAAGILDVVFGSLATLCAGLCAAVLVFYTLSYLPLRRAVAAQETLLREAMLRGERTVRVPACGDTAGLLWEPNTPKMEYAYFYITPGDLSIEFETR